MKTNETVSLYIDLLVEKNMIGIKESLPNIVNINQDIIPSIPFDPAPSEESIDWDWENEKGKVYNKA